MPLPAEAFLQRTQKSNSYTFLCKKEYEYKYPASVKLKNRHKCLLRNFNGAYLSHSLFTFLLFFKKLFLSCYIAAVTFCKHIFTKSFYRLARYNLSAYSSLNRDFEKLARNGFFKLFRNLSTAGIAFG